MLTPHVSHAIDHIVLLILTQTTFDTRSLTLDDIQSDTAKKLADVREVDSDATESYYSSDTDQAVEAVEPVRGVELVECPVCGVMLPQYAIEVHASSCGEQRTAAVASMEPIWID